MNARMIALAALLALGGCAAQQPYTESTAPAPTSQSGSGAKPSGASQPNRPAPRNAITPSQQGGAASKARTHTQFAPPPGGKGRWDPNLGVYVIQGQKDVYYRQRTYYHWDNGWFWGVGPQGPWTATDASGVPPGLGSRYNTP